MSQTKQMQPGEIWVDNERPIKRKEGTEIDRLNRFGLDGSINARFRHASIDQLHLHKDLVDDFKTDQDNEIDFKRMSQFRAQFLPNGGLMGERLQKTISMYRAANKSTNGSGRLMNNRVQSGESPYAYQNFGQMDRMNHTVSTGFSTKLRPGSQMIKPVPRKPISRQSIELLIKNPTINTQIEFDLAKAPLDLQVVGSQKVTGLTNLKKEQGAKLKQEFRLP